MIFSIKWNYWRLLKNNIGRFRKSHIKEEVLVNSSYLKIPKKKKKWRMQAETERRNNLEYYKN